MSDWKALLRKCCEDSSQRAVSAKLGYSAATISLVLKGVYKGDVSAVEKAVLNKLTHSHIACPVLGSISPSECSTQQSKPFSSSSSMRVRLFKACRKCPFNSKRKEV